MRTSLSGSKVLVGAAISASLALGMFACGGPAEPQYPPPPMPDGGFMPPPPPPPPMMDAGPPPAVSQQCDAVQTAALAAMFNVRGATEAPGMKAEGAPVCAVVPEQGTYTGPTMMLQPGYCYTVLGAALPQVSDVALELDYDMSQVPPMLQPFLQGKLQAAVSNTSGNNASIGAKQDCFLWTNPLNLPAMVKLVVKSRAGAGPVAAQIFKKKK